MIENARVIRLDHGVGALLALPPTTVEQATTTTSDGTKKDLLDSNPIYQAASQIRCAYVHISKAIDNKKERTPDALFAKKFSLNAQIPKLRIISMNNWMDNVASCATSNDIVSAAVLTHTDLHPGKIYKAVPVLANLDNGSVLIQLGDAVKGLIPATHLFDKSTSSAESSGSSSNSYRNKVRMEKFKVGNKIDVRCLVISPSERKCLLTAKKSLISSDINNPITDYATIQPGRTATGFISRVSKQGIAITFYNNVFGRISARKLAEEMGVEDPTVDYKVGDVVEVKVRRCTKKAGKVYDDEEDDDDEFEDSYVLDLSLNLLHEEAETSESYESSKDLIKLMKPGMILKSKSLKIVELKPSKYIDESNFLPGHAVVTVKSKHLCSEGEGNDSTKGSINCKLPYEHILDIHNTESIQSPESMDTMASKVLTVGKKIAQEAIVLSTTNRSGSMSSPILSLKPTLIASSREKIEKGTLDTSDVILPTPSTALFMGALVRGYCVRLHPSHGAFIRFLDGLTGIIPKLKGGLDVHLYDTVLCKIVAMDVMNGKAPKILLKQVTKTSKSKPDKKHVSTSTDNHINIADIVKPGDVVGDVKIDNINFARAAVTLLDQKFSGSKVKPRIHVTLAKPAKGGFFEMPLKKVNSMSSIEKDENEKVTMYHPFATWKVGDVVHATKCVAIDVRDGVTYLELTNRDDNGETPLFVDEPTRLSVGTPLTGVITAVAKQNKGLWVQICPGIHGFIPGLEVSDDLEVLNNMRKYFKVGGRVNCCVVKDKSDRSQFKHGVRLSITELAQSGAKKDKSRKPIRGDTIIGRINNSIKQQRAPALMVELHGGFLGRCDITELEEIDDWENMPLGRSNIEDKDDTDASNDNNDDIDENDESNIR